MTFANCPKCGSMNITTAGVCANCGWSQFAKSTVSTGARVVEWGEDMSELKPCPFCGEQVFPPLASSLDDGYTRCGLCGAKMQHRRWQTRPIEDELRKRIAELESAQRWIPVSERLPDNWESVLTIDISKSTRDAVTAFYNPETSCWSTHSAGDLWVTHWMPLPEPPIMYGKVCEE